MMQEFKDSVIERIKKDPEYHFSSEEVEEIVTNNEIRDALLEIDKDIIAKLIKSTGEIEKYLTKEMIKKGRLDSNTIEQLIVATGKINEYLTSGRINEFIPSIIEQLEDMEMRFDNPNLKDYGLQTKNIANLIIKTGEIEKYLTLETKGMLGLSTYDVTRLIEHTGKIEKYLTLDTIRMFGLDSADVRTLIERTGEIEKYLTPEKIEMFGLDRSDVIRLIVETGEIEKYLTPEKLEMYGLKSSDVIKLIEETGEIEKYLTPERLEMFGLDSFYVGRLIEETGKIEKYLTPEIIRISGLKSSDVIRLIEETGKIEKYLTPEIIRISGLKSSDVIRLIEETGEIERYLTPETIKMFRLNSSDVIRLIEETGEIEKYLTSEIIKSTGLESSDVRILIERTGKIEKYLTSETIKSTGLESSDVRILIERTGEIDKYLIPQTIKMFGINIKDFEILISKSGNVKCLTNDMVKEIGLRGENISEILLKRFEMGFAQLVDEEIENGTYDYKKIIRLSEIIKEFQNSNSGKISRIATELALQIYTLDEGAQKDAIELIKNIYLTTNLPTFAQNFLVFKQLHPKFLGEKDRRMYKDGLIGNIPSLSQATPRERNHLIFSDLLRIAIESNNRNLRDYLYIIEKGDELFNLFKKGKLKIDDELPEESRQLLKKYSEILNSLYNQTSKGKRLGKNRVNTENLAQDLQELDKLFLEDTNIQRSLPDRIVRMFGYWAGIKDFRQAKDLIEEQARIADERNRRFAQKGEFTLQEGDFVKGVEVTEHFPSMLQKGIVAKDYLGQNSTSDCTPLDMDIELIGKEGEIRIAKRFVCFDTSGRKLGVIILVIKNDGNYVKTREDVTVNEEGIKTVIKDKSKKEYFDNRGKCIWNKDRYRINKHKLYYCR